MHSYFRFCFRHVLTYSSIIQEHTHAYSEPSVSLAYSKPWHISITKHIQTLRYIHNTILNMFTKAQSSTFDSVLNAPVFYRCYLTSRVIYRCYLTSNSTVSLRLCFRHIQAYWGLIQPYLVLLRHIKSPTMFRDILLRPYSGILWNATHNI